MNQLFSIVIAILFLLPFSAFAEIKTITHTVQQPFGGSQSPDDARIAGVARAKREALERFGTYIESTTVVKNSHLDSDEILAVTAGVTKAEVIKQKNYTEGDGFGLEITVKVELDTAVMDQSLKRLLQDRNHLKDLKLAREREKQLLAKIAELETQQKKKSGKNKNALKSEFKKASQGLTAVEWYDKAMAFWDGIKFSDPTKVVEFLTKSIELDPSNSKVYGNRGVAYDDLNQYQSAINDYTQVVKLEPDNATAYYNRGNTYAAIKQYQQAISNFEQAINLGPRDVAAYYNRGNAYAAINQYHQAISDYTQAIKLDPRDVAAYINRGNSYNALKQYQQAISDFDQAIQLDPSSAPAFYNRGNFYSDLNQYPQAIIDYTNAIQIYSEYAAAYANRGVAFVYTDNVQNGCQDLITACRLGECTGYDAVRQKGLCR